MSHYKYNRIDGNQQEIAQALERIGCKVDYVSRRPYDLVVGRAGRTFLLECKDSSKPPSHRKLTSAQEKFARTWPGHWAKVETVDEAIAAVS